MVAASPNKRTVIDALVLVFSHSKAAEIAGKDALRSVLDVEYSELIEGGAFNLQPVWDLLEGQPGFEAEAATPPLCLFKQWEDRLGIPVTLPEALESISDADRRRAAAECRVPAAEVNKLFADEQDAAARELKRLRRARETQSSRPRLPAVMDLSPRRKLIAGIAAGIAAISFLFVGAALYRSCGDGWEDASAREFAGELPIRDARRLGAQMGATLTDNTWLELPEATRRAHLATAFRTLEPRGINILFLLDTRNNVRASVRRADNELRYQFTR